MELEGKYQLPAKQQLVWEALNDVEVLKKNITGCESMERKSEDQFEALVRAKLGPVSALFTSTISLQDIVPPESYTLVVKGQGGTAGMGEGIVKVNLIEQEGFTELMYFVEMKVYGKLAQVGSRLMKNSINKLSDEFFRGFSEHFGATVEPARPTQADTGWKNKGGPIGAVILLLFVLWLLMN